MAVFAHDSRPHERSHLEGRPPLWVVSGTLQNREPFPVDRVLPDLASFYQCVIWRAFRVWVRHADHSRRILIRCTISFPYLALQQAQGGLTNWLTAGTSRRWCTLSK